MKNPIILRNCRRVILTPKLPYNFDACLHKPSHFPSSDCYWEKGRYWITMVWQGKVLGLQFEKTTSLSISLTIYSEKKLTDDFLQDLLPEIRWRFNLETDISKFIQRFGKDRFLGPLIKKWGGMKPVATNSLFETLMIYFVLQNANVRRSVQMLENLFEALGGKVTFDNKTLSYFWTPETMDKVSEEFLRKLKVGYRAKFFKKVARQFVEGEVDEFVLRQKSCEDIKEEVLKIYGIGPASVEYLLFEDFYCYDSLETIPPWEQKILSYYLFNRELIPIKKLLSFFERYKPFRKLAFHYFWEDLFWQHKRKPISWLTKLIRL